jgi:hypothetical protein
VDRVTAVTKRGLRLVLVEDRQQVGAGLFGHLDVGIELDLNQRSVTRAEFFAGIGGTTTFCHHPCLEGAV